MRFCSLASGSSGNCEYVGNSNTNMLIDAGISTKRIVSSLDHIGVRPEELDGIVITHEHSDHIMGLPVFEGKYNIPLYATALTLEGIERYDKKKKIDISLFNEISADDIFSIGDMYVTPFSTSHDAGDPVCFTVESDNNKGNLLDLVIIADL